MDVKRLGPWLLASGALWVGCQDTGGESPSQGQTDTPPAGSSSPPGETLPPSPAEGSPTPETPPPTQAATDAPTDADTEEPTDEGTRPPRTPRPTPPPVTEAPTASPTPEAPATPVANAPVVLLTQPEEGATVSSGSPVVLQGTVVDLESPPSALELAATSDLDGDLGAPQVDEAGAFTLTALNLSVGTHVLTVTATDPSGLSGSDQLTLTVEEVAGAPVLTLLAPTEARTTEGSEVVVRASVTDDVDDPTTLTVLLSSSLDGELASLTPDASGEVSFATTTLRRGEHTLLLTTQDSNGNPASTGATLTVSGPPIIASVQFFPADPDTSDAVEVQVDAIDAEDTGALSISYQWSVDDAPSDLAGPILPPELTTRGQRWTVMVTVEDPDGQGAAEPASVTIQNAVPTLAQVVISPEIPTTSDTLTCTPSGYADADGDPEDYHYQWLVNGEVAFGATASTLSSGFFGGDTVSCTVRPFDGLEEGAAVSSVDVTIANGAPTVQGVELSSLSPSELDTLTCTPTGGEDPDGDPVEYNFSWQIDGADVPGASEPTLTGAIFDKGDVVTCTVVPTDGAAEGEARVSDPATVINSAPAVTSVVISPQSPTLEDDLTCQAAASDLDPADVVTLSYTWQAGGAPISGQTSATLPAGTVGRGVAITCAVTPDDGEEEGATVTSAPVAMDNTAPSISGVAITPSQPTESSLLTCTPSGYTDAEGDAAVYLYAWTVDGADAGVTTSTLDGASFSKGDVVTCTVTPTDGIASGAALSSAPVTVRNTAPVVTTIAVSPSAPSVSSTLTCEVAATDVDGDSITYTFEWLVNGSAVSGQTGQTLAGVFASGDEVACSATPSDGEAQGPRATSEVVTVGNREPSEPGVSISPANPKPGEALKVNITSPSTDPDGTEVFYTYTWYVGGTLTAYSTEIVPSFVTSDGELWKVEVRATDGSTSSTPGVASVNVTEPDTDGDGWGAYTDCNDTNANVYPGAAEALNNADDDCNGLNDDRWGVDYPYGRDDVGEVSAVAVSKPGVAHFAVLDNSRAQVRYFRIESGVGLFADTPAIGTTTDSGGDWPLDIAADKDNTPHLVIYDTVTSDLVYASPGPADAAQRRWLTTDVDTNGDVGAHPAVAVDDDGVVHISYYDRDNDQLKYARGYQGIFETQVLDNTPGAGTYSDIAVDSSGAVHVAWYTEGSGDVKYAVGADGDFERQTVRSDGDVGIHVRIAVDPVDDTVHLAWIDGATGKISYAVGGLNAFTVTAAIDSSVVSAGRLGLALNPATGAPHVMVFDNTQRDLYHLYKETSTWIRQLAFGYTNDAGLNPDVALDTNQALYTSFYDRTTDQENVIYGSARASQGWSFSFSTLDAAERLGYYNDVAVGTDGQPRLVAYGQSSSVEYESPLLLWQKGLGYFARTIDPDTATNAYVQVELGPSGKLQVSEWDPVETTLYHLESTDGANWTRTELTDVLITTSGVSLDVGADGSTYLVYTDYYGSRPLVCGVTAPYYTEISVGERLAGRNTFTNKALAYACSGTATPALVAPSVVAVNTKMFIAVYRASASELIFLEENNGQLGTPVAVESQDDTGNTPSISYNPVTQQPGIAHINKTTGKLRLSTRTNNAWVGVNVADTFVNGPVVLRYATDGSAHILHRDPTGRRLLYTTNRDGTFRSETIIARPSSSDIGLTAGMELDGDGNPHITYYEANGTDLGYVRGKLFKRTTAP